MATRGSTYIRITKVLEPDQLGAEIEKAMDSLGQAMSKRAQRLVPKRTWALHDTIHYTTSRNGLRVTTQLTAGGGKVGYAIFVEKGTSKMAAQPYLRPAFLQSKSADLKSNVGAPVNHGEVVEARRVKRNASSRARYIGSGK